MVDSNKLARELFEVIGTPKVVLGHDAGDVPESWPFDELPESLQKTWNDVADRAVEALMIEQRQAIATAKITVLEACHRKADNMAAELTAKGDHSAALGASMVARALRLIVP